MEFLHRLARQRSHPLSDLAGQVWALTVGTLQAYEYRYHMWDTLTTGYLGAPELMTLRQTRTEVISRGPSSGRIIEVERAGKPVQAATTIQVDAFLEYVLNLFKR